MDLLDDFDEEPQTFRERYGPWIGGGVAIVAIGLAAIFLLPGKGDREPPKRVHEVTMVKILPPPPPPPPPPPQQPVQQQKMVEQPQMKMPEIKQETPQPKAPKPDQPPPGPLGLDAKGTGPGDAFGLAGRPGGNGLLGGSGEGGGGGSKWGWYATMVQTQIEDALRSNKKTRDAQLRIEVRIWSDADGRIERVKLGSSTGNAEIDAAIEKEVLAGLKLRQPPPKDMPMPIVMRVTERRPS